MTVGRKIVVHVGLICLTLGLLCACSAGDKGKTEESLTLVPTKEVSETKSQKPTVIPTETSEPEEGGVPIDAEHFSSATFREYIAEYIDVDKDGVLSEQERATVTFMALQYEYKGECLDGFEYFPNLWSLYVNDGAQVVVKNCSSLSLFNIEYGEFETLQVFNCPNLEKIEIFSCEGESVQIAGCPKLQTAELNSNKLDSFSIMEVSETSVCLDGWVDYDKMTLDRNVSFQIVSADGSVRRSRKNGEAVKVYTSAEAFLSDTEIEWVGTKPEDSLPEEESLLDMLSEMTSVLMPEEVPVTEEFFSDVAFRTVISALYDADKNGILSRSEREDVTELIWDGAEFEGLSGDFDNAVLDGLEAFPKLVSVEVKCADKVILNGHPSVKSIGGDTGGADFYIKNCPKLENMGFSFFGGNVAVKNCENLRRFAAHQTSFDNLAFSETPQLVVSLTRVDKQGRIQADADVVVGVEQYQNGLDGIRVDGNGRMTLYIRNCVEWDDVSEESIEVSEGGFSVCLDSEEVFGTGVWVTNENEPNAGQIQIRLNEHTEIEVLEYSPNKVLSFCVCWGLDVVCSNEAEEEILERLPKRQWWTIYPDGTRKSYTTMEEWRDNEGYVYARNMEYGG